MSTTGFHLYQKERSNNYNYIDRVVKNYFEMGGMLMHVYPMKSIVDAKGVEHQIGEEGLYVSDNVFVENNQRRYFRETFDLYGVTQMKPPTWTTLFSGLSSLDGDEKQVWIHYNSMIAQLGRKIIVGDVIEFSWIRDLDILGKESAANKFYQVTSSERDEASWAPNYKFHIWLLKLKPITNSPEFEDLFNKGEEDEFYEPVNSDNGGGGLDPEMTQDDNLNDINDKNLEEAEEDVSFRLHDEHHVYMLEDTNPYKEGRFIPIGIDGIPAELNADQVPMGDSFPRYAEVGSYYLKTNFNPPRLYVREEGHWKLIGYDARTKWMGVPNVLLQTVNNTDSVSFSDGTELTKRQNIKDLVKARVKKEHNAPKDWKKIVQQRFEDTPTGI